jgi:hypothetical protein
MRVPTAMCTRKIRTATGASGTTAVGLGRSIDGRSADQEKFAESESERRHAEKSIAATRQSLRVYEIAGEHGLLERRGNAVDRDIRSRREDNADGILKLETAAGGEGPECTSG